MFLSVCITFALSRAPWRLVITDSGRDGSSARLGSGARSNGSPSKIRQNGRRDVIRLLG